MSKFKEKINDHILLIKGSSHWKTLALRIFYHSCLLGINFHIYLFSNFSPPMFNDNSIKWSFFAHKWLTTVKMRKLKSVILILCPYQCLTEVSSQDIKWNIDFEIFMPFFELLKKPKVAHIKKRVTLKKSVIWKISRQGLL